MYLLRKHKTMPGCGAFSFYGVGSFVLFPTFVLRIDDSVDNVVSYKSIGSAYEHLDYAQPRALRASSLPKSLPTSVKDGRAEPGDRAVDGQPALDQTPSPQTAPHLIPADDDSPDPATVPSGSSTRADRAPGQSELLPHGGPGIRTGES